MKPVISPRYKSLIPYYGGKSKLSHLYSPPEYNTIIEPFAGGASYALRYSERNVWLNDLNGSTVAVWRFLTGGQKTLDFVTKRIPKDIAQGTHISELVRDDDPEGFVWLVRANMAQGAFGMKGIRNKVSPFGEKAWSSKVNGAGGFRARLEYWIPRIAHWKVTMLSYDDLPNQQACWFVDPPYANAAGRKYAIADVDYAHLATWCQSRDGQVIVCENNDAEWLPFKKLTDKRLGIYDGVDASALGEAVWEKNDGGEVGLW